MSLTKSGNYFIYTLLALVVFFAGANVSSEIILRGELVSLPDLVGKTAENARAELAVKRIGLAIRERQFSSRLEKDRIISQEPAAGSRIKPRRTVKVVVSLGSEQVAVPLFEGRSFESAVGVLKEAGLRRGHLSQIHTAAHAAGRIIAQDPSPGAVVARSTPVNFLVSQGDWEDRYIMPDLIGMRAQAVLRKLQDLGFKVTEVSYTYYPGYEPGVILKQFPVQGQQVLKRNEIALEVSR